MKSDTSLRALVCDVMNLSITASKVSNVFQCKNKSDSNKKPFFLTLSHFYIAWFCQKFPLVKIDGIPSNVLQIFMNMQRTREASRDLHNFISSVNRLQSIFIQHGFFVGIHNYTFSYTILPVCRRIYCCKDESIHIIKQAFDILSQ